MKLFIPLLAALTFSCTSGAFASGEGFYFGANAIDGNIGVEDKTINGITYEPGSKNSFGGGITVGYNASQYFAIDTAFDGLNKIDYEGTNAPSVNYWFGYAAVKPMLPFWKFNAFIEIGAAYVSFTQSSDNSDSDNEASGSQLCPFGGVGFGFNFNPNVELALSINRIEDVSTPITFGMLTLTYHVAEHYEDSGFLAD